MHFKIEYTKEELDNEVWKPIPFYEDLYEASSLGRIRTKEGKTTYTKRHGVRCWEQRILKPKTIGDTAYKTGYRVDLWKDGKPKTLLVARLVASSFLSNELTNRKMTVNHINENRLDNRVENLEWTTLKENIQKGYKNNAYNLAKKKVKLIKKTTGEESIFSSLVDASKYLHFCRGYLSNKIKKGFFENDQYKWELLN